MSTRHDKLNLGIEAVVVSFLSAFVYGLAYVALSEQGADSFRLMWMAYALVFLAPLLIPLALLAQLTLVRYAKGPGERFSYWRAALLGALTGELLILPATAVHVLHGGTEVEFGEVFDFLAFGVTSGLVPWSAGSFMVWAFFKNLRLDAARKARAREDEKREAEAAAKKAANRPPVPPSGR